MVVIIGGGGGVGREAAIIFALRGAKGPRGAIVQEDFEGGKTFHPPPPTFWEIKNNSLPSGVLLAGAGRRLQWLLVVFLCGGGVQLPAGVVEQDRSP